MVALTVALIVALIALAVVSVKVAKQSVLPNGYFVVYDTFNDTEIATLTPEVGAWGVIEYVGVAQVEGTAYTICPYFVGFKAQVARVGLREENCPFTADALNVTKGQIIRMSNVTLEVNKTRA